MATCPKANVGFASLQRGARAPPRARRARRAPRSSKGTRLIASGARYGQRGAHAVRGVGPSGEGHDGWRRYEDARGGCGGILVALLRVAVA